jgi:hypothetical protein
MYKAALLIKFSISPTNSLFIHLQAPAHFLPKPQASSLTAKMVSFRNLVVSALALAAPIVAQTTPAQMVDNIKMITQKSQALQAPAQSITVVNGPLIVIGT